MVNSNKMQHKQKPIFSHKRSYVVKAQIYMRPTNVCTNIHIIFALKTAVKNKPSWNAEKKIDNKKLQIKKSWVYINNKKKKFPTLYSAHNSMFRSYSRYTS